MLPVLLTQSIIPFSRPFPRSVVNRVIFMDQGSIVEDAKKDGFFGSPRSARAQDFLSKILHH